MTTIDINGKQIAIAIVNNGDTFHHVYKLSNARKWRTLAWGFEADVVQAHADRRIVKTLAGAEGGISKEDPTTDWTPEDIPAS